MAVDAEVVERLSAPAENELQNVVNLFQRKVVRYRNQPGDERADFQQYDPEGQAITTRWGGHEPTLPTSDPRLLGGLGVVLLRRRDIKIKSCNSTVAGRADGS